MVLPVQTAEDIVRMRQAIRERAVNMGFSLVDQTKIVTAASELARNALVHGGGGVARLETLQEGDRRGLRLTFADKGPGIPDVPQALRDLEDPARHQRLKDEEYSMPINRGAGA